MFIVFFGSVILRDSPLNAVQMLWVNLIMDTFAALALATEPPHEEILDRMPYHKDAPIITEIMWRNVFGHSIYQITVLVFLIFAGAKKHGYIQDYQLACLQRSAQDECLVWNPYFTQNLYYTEEELTTWNRNYNDGLFDHDLLSSMVYDTESKKEKLPAEGDPTQKLLHFTVIF